MTDTTDGNDTHPVDPDRVAAARARLPSGEDAARLSAMFGLLADPVRVRVLYALDLVQELCVGDVALALNVSEHAAGYALRILRTAGLITGRKTGRMVYYRLADAFPQPLREHCLRRLVELSQINDAEYGDQDR